MREQEHKFYARLRGRLKNIRLIRVENTLDVGFPDVLLVNRSTGDIRLAELKSEFQGGHVYVRNTQISYSYRLLDDRVDLPYLVSTIEGGFYIIFFSSLKELPHSPYKQDHKKFSTKDFPGAVRCFYAPQRSDWEPFLTRVLYTPEIHRDTIELLQRGD